MRDAFLARGIDAISCDLKPTRSPGPHFQCDVRKILYREPWAGIIAHPDCTYITNSGVRWLDRDIGRWKLLYQACEFFKLFLGHPCERVAIENPVPHKYAIGWLGHKYTQTIQPYQFGHTETKRTALWLKGLAPLQETHNVKAMMDRLPKRETNRVHYASPGPLRAQQRSETYAGIAAAMAEQWGMRA